MKHLGKKTEYKLNKPDPELLERFKNKHPKNTYLVPFVQERDEFTSLCPATGQPDYARFEIIYIPDKWCVESKSLKLYLMSFRNHGEFHEDVTNRILNTLYILLDPLYIRVIGNFASRGGLAIRPMVEKYHPSVLNQTVDRPFFTQFSIERRVNQWDIRQDLR